MDIVFCDYGAMTSADPYRSVPEVARLLRPGGLFAFNTSSPLLDVCWADDAERAGDRLVRDYFGMHRLDADDGMVSFQLPYGEWVGLFRSNGLEILELIELRPSPDAVSSYRDDQERAWSRRWPAECIWRLRRRRGWDDPTGVIALDGVRNLQATPPPPRISSSMGHRGRPREAAVDQRLSLITLGVGDVSRAQAFYEALGWHLDGGVDDENDHVAFFQAGGLILALWDRGKLAADSGVEDPGGWGGVTLAHNVRSAEEVDAVLDQARAAGATIARAGAATFWGGYSGVFIDPDGHPWEVAHNPGWTVHEDGRTTLD